jgi:hypothetical protein
MVRKLSCEVVSAARLKHVASLPTAARLKHICLTTNNNTTNVPFKANQQQLEEC